MYDQKQLYFQCDFNACRPIAPEIENLDIIRQCLAIFQKCYLEFTNAMTRLTFYRNVYKVYIRI